MKSFRTWLCVTALVGCVVPSSSAKEGDKGERAEVDAGALTFAPTDGEIASDTALAYALELGGPAVVSLATEAEGVDTMLFVREGETLLDEDDDGGEGLLSRLEIALDAGTYTVVVGGWGEAAGAFTLHASCEGEGCPEAPEPMEPEPMEPEPMEPEPTEPEPMEPEDPWALARDVNLHNVAFTDATPIPESYTRASDTGPVSLSGPEWWQRWSGGATQSFSWSQGTDYGKRCGQANAIRLEALWHHEEIDAEGNVTRPGRDAFEAILDGSGWRGTMYNWTEDVSEGGWPSFRSASMWAWRTGAIKFVNVVHEDGSCDLPTLELLQDFADACLPADDGEIQGCRASAR